MHKIKPNPSQRGLAISTYEKITSENRKALKTSSNEPKRVAIVRTLWDELLVDGVVAEIKKQLGAENVPFDELTAPYLLDLPRACKSAAASGRFHAVIAVGFFIRQVGSFRNRIQSDSHFDCACRGLMDLNAGNEVPIINGIVWCAHKDETKQFSEIAKHGEINWNPGRGIAMSAILHLIGPTKLSSAVSGSSEFKDFHSSGAVITNY